MDKWIYRRANQPDEAMKVAAVQRQLQLTKPPGSLGRLEDIAVELSAMQGRLNPSARNVQIAVFAGDHGVACEGVSAFPQVVTVEMVKNFIRGGAAISVMAKELGAGLTVVNAGTVSEQPFAQPVVDRPVSLGTQNLAAEPAMTLTQCYQALELGKDITDGFPVDTEIVIGGEMGIANTTSATALAAVFGAGAAAELVGPGTGLDNKGVERKCKVIERALMRFNEAHSVAEPLVMVCELGGFEIAALAGYFIRAAQQGFPILVDGFIASAAALAACRINPSVRPWMIFAHSSAEPGHRLVLEALHARPLLSLGMRLGEGSGSAVAVSLLRSACALQNGMATFAEAGVSDS
jgi:nicotinate-nucleotide--dimethylbenzimidazole phosphoribosyltransferase